MKPIQVALVTVSLAYVAEAADPASFVLTNGKIYTVNPGQPWAEAVAVNGSKIVYVGGNAGAKEFVGEHTESIDLKGRLVLPGFIESHIHVAAGASTTSGLILTTEDSLEDVLQKLAAYAKEHPDKPVIFGASYLSSLFPEGPSKELLDMVVPDRPVFLMDQTLHSVWVNSKTYEAAGISADTPNPPGGEYVKNDKGELSGWIKGGPAHIPVLEKIRAITPEAIRASIPPLLEGLTEFGFTSAIDMGAPFGSEAAFAALQTLDKEGKLPLRLSVTYYVNTPAKAETAVAELERLKDTYTSENVWFDTLKISGDSVIENQKAAMLEPFLTTGDRGSLYFDRAQLNAMTIPAAEKGFNVTIHTIGDWAVRTALDSFADVRKAGYNVLLSTTHSQMVHPDDRPRYKQLNVIAQTTGNWAVPQKGYLELLGRERNDNRQFPLQTWVSDGVTVALGADWPATPGGFEHGVNPFNNIYCSMFRRAPAHIRDALNSFDATLLPVDEVLTLEQAVAGYTINGAIMLGIQDTVGSIEVGKKADMILLDQNLFEIEPEKIPHTKVLATMFDGRIVHDVVYELGDADLVALESLGDGAAGPCCRCATPHTRTVGGSSLQNDLK